MPISRSRTRGPWLQHLLLPAATLALQFAALYVRMVRSNMLAT